MALRFFACDNGRWSVAGCRRALLGGLALMLALLASPRPALACTPPPGGLPRLTAADRTRAAEIVLEGSVSAVTGSYPADATVQVAQYLKGDGPSEVTISGFGPSSLCLSEVSVGQRLIFYARRDAAGGLAAFYASQFDAVAPADPQTIAEVRAAASQAPLSPTVAPARLPETGGRAPGALPLVAALLIAIAGGLLALRRQT